MSAGYDFHHRERVAQNYKDSLSWTLLVLKCIESIFDRFHVQLPPTLELYFNQIPEPANWELILLISIIPILFGYASLSHNNKRFLYVYIFGIIFFSLLPLSAAFFVDVPNLKLYLTHKAFIKEVGKHLPENLTFLNDDLIFCLQNVSGYVIYQEACVIENQLRPPNFDIPSKNIKNNLTACNFLANLCVLYHFTDSNIFCKIYHEIEAVHTASANRSILMPSLQYNQQISLLKNYDLNNARIMVTAFDIHGRNLGDYDITSILLCPLPNAYLANSILKMHKFSTIKCTIQPSTIWDAQLSDIIFFEPYLVINGNKNALNKIPIPIYITSPMGKYLDNVADTNSVVLGETLSSPNQMLPSALTTDKSNIRKRFTSNDMSTAFTNIPFYRRFFLYENIASPVSITKKDSNSSLFANSINNNETRQRVIPFYVQYVSRIDILINQRETPNILFMIEYDTLQYRNFFTSSGTLKENPKAVKTSLNIDHVSNAFTRMINRSAVTLIAIMACAVCFPFAFLRVWTWSRRNTHSTTNYHHHQTFMGPGTTIPVGGDLTLLQKSCISTFTNIDLEWLVRLTLRFVGPFALLLFAVVWLYSIIIALMYRANLSNMLYPLPSRWQERIFYLLIIVALAFLFIHLLYHLSRQTNYQLYFIDWEYAIINTNNADELERNYPSNWKANENVNHEKGENLAQTIPRPMENLYESTPQQVDESIKLHRSKKSHDHKVKRTKNKSRKETPESQEQPNAHFEPGHLAIVNPASNQNQFYQSNLGTMNVEPFNTAMSNKFLPKQQQAFQHTHSQYPFNNFNPSYNANSHTGFLSNLLSRFNVQPSSSYDNRSKQPSSNFPYRVECNPAPYYTQNVNFNNNNPANMNEYADNIKFSPENYGHLNQNTNNSNPNDAVDSRKVRRAKTSERENRNVYQNHPGTKTTPQYANQGFMEDSTDDDDNVFINDPAPYNGTSKPEKSSDNKEKSTAETRKTKRHKKDHLRKRTRRHKNINDEEGSTTQPNPQSNPSQFIYCNNASRILYSIHAWCRLQTYREIPNRTILFLGLFILYFLDNNPKDHCYTGNNPAGIEITAQGSVRLRCMPQSGILRFAIIASVYALLALVFWIGRKLLLYLYNSVKILNKNDYKLGALNNFLDTCKTLNISIFILKERNYAIYYHAQNTFGRADVSYEEYLYRIRYKKEMMAQLKMVRDSALAVLAPLPNLDTQLDEATTYYKAMTGLGDPNIMSISPSKASGVQSNMGEETGANVSPNNQMIPYMSLEIGKCYEILLSLPACTVINQALFAIQQPLITQFLSFTVPGLQDDNAMFEKRLMAWQYTNSLMVEFLSGRLAPYMSYQIVNKTWLERILSFESLQPLDVSYIYPQSENNGVMKRLLLWDHQIYLFVLELLIVICIDYATLGYTHHWFNALLPGVWIACIFDWLICKLLYLASKRNICAKTMVDFNLI